MKYFLSVLILMVIGVCINAQPLIHTNNLPPAGYKILAYTFNGAVLDPGDTGANKVWDFTTFTDSMTPVLTSDSSQQYIMFVDASTSPFISQFPTSNYCCVQNNTSPAGYYYFVGDNNVFSETAHSITGDSSHDKNGIFTIPHILLEFPCAYGQVIETTWQLPGEILTHDTITYDAYGTLKTSLGTITNVVRFKIRSTGSPENYEFWTTDPAFPLLSVYPGSASILFEPQSLSGIDEAGFLQSLTILPNPSSGPAELCFALDKGSAVDARLYDLAGKELKQVYNGNLQPGKNSLKIDNSNLAPGMYIISILAGNSLGRVKYIKD